jgi:hypothetical protein
LKEVTDLAKCPTCGKEIQTPIKEWDMGKNRKTHVKQYACCGKKFCEYGKRV